MLSEVSTRQVHDELAFVDSLEPLRGTSDIRKETGISAGGFTIRWCRNGAPQRVKDEANKDSMSTFSNFRRRMEYPSTTLRW